MASSLPPLAQAVAGSVGATISNALVFPLDTLTTRLQASNPRRRPAPVFKTKVARRKSSSTTLADAIESLWHSGGAYSGLASDSLSTAISQFLYFFAYSFLRDRLVARKLGTRDSKKPKPVLLTAVEELLVGCVAGVVAKAFVSPLSMIAVRQQTSSEPREDVVGGREGDTRPVEGATSSDDDDDDPYGVPPSAISIAREIYRDQGLQGFWSGFQSTVVLTLNPAITFYAFAALKRALVPARNREHPTPIQTFLCGAFASSLASVATYPLILAKTRLQFKSPTGRALYASPIDVFRRAYAKQGFAGLYAGVEGQLLKGFVNEGLKLLIKERLELIIVLIAQFAYRRKTLARA